MKNRKAMIILVIALLAIAVIVSIPVLHVQAEYELPAADASETLSVPTRPEWLA